MPGPHDEPPGDGFVTVDVAGPVATVVLSNAAHRNAVPVDGWGALTDALEWIAGRRELRVAVVTGEGGDFCAGADLGKGPDGNWLAYMRYVNRAALALAAVPQPTIARVDGYAVGAGANLAFGCDLVVASDRSRFSEIFARRGLSLDFGGSWSLPRRVGLHKAKELALLAPIVDAAEAERLGLVNKVVPAEQLDEAVAVWADALAAGPPVALAQTKALLDASHARTLPEALEAEAAAQAVNFGTADTAEAIAAFLAKRPPRFEGR